MMKFDFSTRRVRRTAFQIDGGAELYARIVAIAAREGVTKSHAAASLIIAAVEEYERAHPQEEKPK